MIGKPKQLIAFAFAVVPIAPLVMAVLGLATGPNSRSQISAGHAILIPLRAPVPTMPMPVPRSQPLIAVAQTFPQGFGRPYPPALPAVASPARMSPVYVPHNQPLIGVNQATPQGVANLLPPLPASSLAGMLPFQEAHWQGIEVVPPTNGLKRLLKIFSDTKGVIIDDVTAPADLQGFLAGDLITSVGQIPTPDLESFLQAADRVRARRRTEVQLLRKNKSHSLVLTALQMRLGTANGETAPMIKPGSRPPHGYKGACTNCHRIGNTGQLAVDNGDLLTRDAPPIRAGQTPPHRDRGACTACHTIVR